MILLFSYKCACYHLFIISKEKRKRYICTNGRLIQRVITLHILKVKLHIHYAGQAPEILWNFT